MRSGQFDGSAAHNMSQATVNGQAQDLPRQLVHSTAVTNPYFLAGSPDASPVANDYVAVGTSSGHRTPQASNVLQPAAPLEPSYKVHKQQHEEEQQRLAEHFLWRPDSQTPTVIRG